MILYLGAGGNHNIFFLENLMEDWIFIATLQKYLLKALAMPDGLLVVSSFNCDSSGRNMVTII